MSAEIDPLETQLDTDNSMEEAAAGDEGLTVVKNKKMKIESDAADFLLYNSKYHDCFFTVGNPETDEVEKIGVASLYLITNSPVFRKMLGSYKQADLPNAKIIVSDVSPATFKLMLRYIYGGELPQMTAIETAGLALCADKYKITRLVRKTLKRLIPTSAEDVFPAFICVTFARFPDLEVQVSKIIQRETDKVVERADFLQLDEACVIFMLKQDTMNIDEVELWKHVVRWAEHQVEINPARTVRDCLAKILGYVRLLTFTLEEIAEHVLPAEVINPEEFMDLVRAVTKNQPLRSCLLCNVQEKRDFYQEKEVNAQSTLSKKENETIDPSESAIVLKRAKRIKYKTKHMSSLTENKPESIVFNNSCAFRASDHFNVGLHSSERGYSTLEIIPIESIKIESFTCTSCIGQPNEKYEYVCNITITKSDQFKQEVCVKGSTLCNDEIVLPLKFSSGKPIVMNPYEEWVFDLHWNGVVGRCKPLCLYQPVHNLLAPDDTWGHIDVTKTPIEEENMTVYYKTPFHVVQIAYKTQ